jgi:hypothetical protein
VLHFRVKGKRGKVRFVPVQVLAQRLIEEYLALAGHAADVSGPVFRPVTNNRGKQGSQKLTFDASRSTNPWLPRLLEVAWLPALVDGGFGRAVSLRMAKNPLPGMWRASCLVCPRVLLERSKGPCCRRHFCGGLSREPSEGKGWPLARPEAFWLAYGKPVLDGGPCR